MSVPALPSYSDSPERFCPSCGTFVNALDEVTGWCELCNGVTLSNTNNVSSVSAIESNQRPHSKGPHATSKFELALAANADAIEYITRDKGDTGATSLTRALELARSDRPTCVVCGERIKRSSRNAVFCRTHSLCRLYSRRYVYLYRERKPPMSKSEALATILEQLNGEL